MIVRLLYVMQRCMALQDCTHFRIMLAARLTLNSSSIYWFNIWWCQNSNKKGAGCPGYRLQSELKIPKNEINLSRSVYKSKSKFELLHKTTNQKILAQSLQKEKLKLWLLWARKFDKSLIKSSPICQKLVKIPKIKLVLNTVSTEIVKWEI